MRVHKGVNTAKGTVKLEGHVAEKPDFDTQRFKNPGHILLHAEVHFHIKKGCNMIPHTTLSHPKNNMKNNAKSAYCLCLFVLCWGLWFFHSKEREWLWPIDSIAEIMRWKALLLSADDGVVMRFEFSNFCIWTDEGCKSKEEDGRSLELLWNLPWTWLASNHSDISRIGQGTIR